MIRLAAYAMLPGVDVSSMAEIKKRNDVSSSDDRWAACCLVLLGIDHPGRRRTVDWRVNWTLSDADVRVSGQSADEQTGQDNDGRCVIYHVKPAWPSHHEASQQLRGPALQITFSPLTTLSHISLWTLFSVVYLWDQISYILLYFSYWQS